VFVRLKHIFLPKPVKAFGEMECEPWSSLSADYSVAECLAECRDDYIYNICSCVGHSSKSNITFNL